MHLDKKTIRHIFLCVIGCIAFYWLLHEPERFQSVWNTFIGILAPFVVGAAIAFIVNVPMRSIENKLGFIKQRKLRRAVALVLTLIIIVVVIVGVVMLLVPQVEQTIADLVAELPGFFEELQIGFDNLLDRYPELREWYDKTIKFDWNSMDWGALIQKAADMLSKSLSSIFSGAVSVVGNLAGAIFNAVISFVFSLYCLAHKDTLARQGRKLLYSIIPEKFADEIIRILRMTNSAFSNFITGQCLEAVILSLLFVIAMMIFQMPYIPLICVLICVTALIPLVGAFVGCILGAFFILVSDPLQAVTFVIMFLVIQQFEGNVIYPRVVGSSIGLPGMWVLLAVTVGGELMGVGGMLMMVPLASVLYTLLREFAQKQLQKRSIPQEKLIPQPPELQSHFRMKLENKKAAKAKSKQAEDQKTEE